MKKKFEERMELPADLKIELDGATIKMQGLKGSIERRFDNPRLRLELKEGILYFISDKATKKEKKVVGTFKAEIKNMIKGVNNSCVYKMKVCSGHFPMKVAVLPDKVEIRNFLGEKIPRVVRRIKGVEIKVDANDITLEGIDKKAVSQQAADIEQKTRRTAYDRRIFQDGIYITNKDGKELK